MPKPMPADVFSERSFKYDLPWKFTMARPIFRLLNTRRTDHDSSDAAYEIKQTIKILGDYWQLKF